MQASGERGSIVSLVCDRGDRYEDTYNNDAWVAERGHDIAPYAAVLASAWDDGVWLG